MPKKTVAVIIETGNDYLVQVKGNQPTLKASLEETAARLAAADSAETSERNKGREEHRRLTLWTDCSLVDTALWCCLTSILRVERWGSRQGVAYSHTHWYISSAEASAAEFLYCVRAHWSVENKCHWVKDVSMGEDKTPTNDASANTTLALIRNIVINIFRLNGFSSIKEAIEHYTNYVKELFEMLRT